MVYGLLMSFFVASVAHATPSFEPMPDRVSPDLTV